ncbi:hypothetical protein ACFX13_047406 [Malus domestica]
MEFKFEENFEMKIKKHTDDAASRVAAVLQRVEEQGCMIESLHTFVSSSRVDGVKKELTSSFSLRVVKKLQERLKTRLQNE